ncbi:hypothetical protein [Sphingomonas aerophila]|jgi:hypothetical protein|uniref:Uncharacterized protein n=1 Tax=Sphingomonas aerophila TaxID=1344948 RepID=A0A7W9EUP9_9SPHN|nr:hypothetical protein [Sphingomonas aerophila]MBB5713872.1 hypothetical protein [Sphingomonas aerophila]
MNLLLLLSAFLTALTGAITGVRPAQTAAAQEQVVSAARVLKAYAETKVARPAQGWPGLSLLPTSAERPFAPLATVPAFGQRRRE